MGEKMTVDVVPTLLGEMQLPLYLRGDGRNGGQIGDHKKKSYWGAA